MSIYVFLIPGCRLARVNGQAGEYTYKGNTMVITSDGKSYSRLNKDVVFRFSPNRVRYEHVVDDQVYHRDFEVALSKVSYDGSRYYYIKKNNNLFILDERRRTLQIYGPDREGKARSSFSGHTFLDMTRVYNEEPLMASRE